MARIDDFKESFRLAGEELKGSDLERVAFASGAEFEGGQDGDAILRLTFLGQSYTIRVGDGVDIFKEGQENEVPLPEKILMCHYLLRADGVPCSGELITFRQVPDGHFYFDAFQRRARDPLLASFGQKPDLFKTCGKVLGAQPVENGDVGMAFQVLPQISIQLILWKGDEEFPPDANILFDSSIQQRLSAEDIAVMSGMLVYRLMGIARGMEARS